MNIIKEYFNYVLKAKGRHGTHSPFVYNLVDKCLHTKIDKKNEFFIKNFYKELSKNDDLIDFTDFGAGSKKMNKFRKVKNILKNSSSKGKYAKLLFKVSKYYKPNNILELGTSLGVGTLNLHLGNPDSIITSVEGCPNTFKYTYNQFQNLKPHQIKLINNKFSNFIENLEKDMKFDLIYIDGHHDGKALANYIEILKPHYHNNTIIILDDIRWSNSMLNSWKKISSSENFHVSIDFFRMGLITPRKEQGKEHFIIKF